MKLPVLALLFIHILSAQAVRLRVYSEFQRVDPFGEILAIDRSETPREILSPAVARNSFASFHVAVTTPPKTGYFLAVQSYPADTFRWTIYEEKFVASGDSWIPDTLLEARRPYFGAMPDPAANIPGQTTRVYLLDVWTPPETPVGPARLEVWVKVGYWRVAPMEVRVQSARVPNLDAGNTGILLPPITQPADAAATGTLEQYLKGKSDSAPKAASKEMSSVRSVIRRNAVQDMALARQLEPRLSREEIVQRIRRIMTSRSPGAEWYLKTRDFLYREASR